MNEKKIEMKFNASETYVPQGQERSISCVRIVTFLMILICHICQYYNSELMMWFNVGVQVSLATSGFLYGQKEIESVASFYKRRFIKILIPYYITFIGYSFFQFILAKETFDKSTFIGGLFLHKQVQGGGHLWFIPTLLMCYLITPILNDYKKRIENKKDYLKISIIIVTFVIVFFSKFNGYFRAAWIACYVIAYFIGLNETNNFISNKGLIIISSIIAITGNTVQIYSSYLTPGSGYVNYEYLSTPIYGVNHVSLGLFIFLSLKYLFTKIPCINNMDKLLSITDKYSYEAYLLHQFLILGPFSLLDKIKVVPFSIIMIIIGIIALSGVLKEVENRVYNRIAKAKKGQEFNWGDISDYRTELMGVSIIFIMFFHCTIDFSVYPAIAVVKSFGNMGVDIFLIVSAIGLYKSFFDRNRTIYAFYKRRVIRIIPTTLICMIPWYIYLYHNGREYENVLRFVLDITSLSFWIDGNNRSWYIALTLFLYLIYPLIFLLVQKNLFFKEKTIFGIILGFFILINCMIAIYFPDWFGAVNLALRRIPTFVLGCAIAKAVNEKKKTEVPVVFLSLLIAMGTSYSLINYRNILEPMAMWAYLYGVFALCIIIIVSFIFKVSGATFIKKVFRYLGKYTLEIYLIHTQVLTVMEQKLVVRINHEKVIINVLTAITSLLLAYLVNSIISKISTIMSLLIKRGK